MDTAWLLSAIQEDFLEIQTLTFLKNKPDCLFLFWKVLVSVPYCIINSTIFLF